MDYGMWNDRTNMSMLTDFYELTMANGYLNSGNRDKIVYFDMFFRNIPENGGYAVMAGLEQVIDYLSSLKFSEDDLTFLKDNYHFNDEFISYLRDFEFTCDVWAIPEGTVVFPKEPLVKVRGPIIQAQLLETALLCTINHQTLIATKTARIVRAAEGRPVMEFGARRAQGFDASVLGARAAYIAGAAGTSCTICGQQFDIPLSGTMAHSWVMLFDNEFEAFKAYSLAYPDGALLLVDTYDVLRSGIPNAIKCAKEVLEPMGKRLKGIRIDSGDLTYMTQSARKMLDEAGLTDCKITVSNALDEYLIRDLISQGACIDSFGVGERLITSKAEPVFGGVYKIAAVEADDGTIIPKMKISDSVGKVTNPCSKKIVRFYDNATGKALADVVMMADEEIPNGEPYEIFDPENTWKSKVLENYRTREIMVQIFKDGKLVYNKPTIAEIRAYCTTELDSLWDSVKRFENPHNYYVDLSPKLWKNMANPIVTIQMKDGGVMKAELYPEIAPITVQNFIDLASKGFYNGLIFHRVIPGFMIQGGDPDGIGTGGPGYCIKGEFRANGFRNDLKHTRGVLSMARAMDPDSAGSQFFIMHEDYPSLDGQYAAFGKLIEGIEVVDKIASVRTDYMDKPLEPQQIEFMTVQL